ncbi:MAG: hypothetical protein KDC71_12445 [Acidobacteria bacterium]|nr:hypothetical protein [Acidobacteriota bacterium]
MIWIPLLSLFLQEPKILAWQKNSSDAAFELAQDRALIMRYRTGLLENAESLKRLLEQDPDDQPVPENRALVREAWAQNLDYLYALDSLLWHYRDFEKVPDFVQPCFVTYFAAFLAQYRAALAWCDVLDAKPAYHRILNEAMPELGIPEGSFAQFKTRFLHVAMGKRFGELVALDSLLGKREWPEERKMRQEDTAWILQFGMGRGEWLTLKNGLQMVSDQAQMQFFPVQKQLASAMGNSRVQRTGQALISAQQIEDLHRKLQPGDVLLERREWYLSNIGIPGFWCHAALYIGTPEERLAFFQDERGLPTGATEFERQLQSQFPRAYANHRAKNDHGEATRVIEAIADGVVFTSLEHSCHADSVAVLRPHLTKTQIAQALQRAFSHAGKPYDYQFDFATDQALVCSELVFKAYEGLIDFSFSSSFGKQMVPPNQIAADYSRGPETQWLFVVFLDGSEIQNRALEADQAAFSTSYLRPKWHILVQ